MCVCVYVCVCVRVCAFVCVRERKEFDVGGKYLYSDEDVLSRHRHEVCV